MALEPILFMKDMDNWNQTSTLPDKLMALAIDQGLKVNFENTASGRPDGSVG